MGLHQAFPEARIYGVDIEPQKRYPFNFYQADVFEWAAFEWRDFDFIWASPPCQRFSDLAKRNGNGHEHPDLIGTVRVKLIQSGRPYIIENVDNAPLISPQMLCGTMFGLKVFRHRIFETSFGWDAPQHKPHAGSTGTHRYPYKSVGGYVQVTGGGNCTVAEAKAAMEIDWMTKAELNEAIPPAYSRFLGEQFKRYQEPLGRVPHVLPAYVLKLNAEV